ncbi:MAG: YeeE/YedE family protein [Phycisphaerae bacterium]|nr:YeeE/YedE family protein [Phycisphaerae bacterium]
MILPAIVVLVLCGATALAQQRGASPTPEDAGQTSVWRQVRWSPYVVGAGIGILSMLTLLISKEAIGVSGAFAQTSGMLEKLFRGKTAPVREYYREHPPVINWGWMFVVGLMLGSFVSARLSGDFRIVSVPARWLESGGDSRLLRWGVAFVGGIIMGFGARWARGCTSGHGISGTLQLAVSSWIVTGALFISGIATAMLLFHVVMQ